LANTINFPYFCISANDVRPVPSPRGTKSFMKLMSLVKVVGGPVLAAVSGSGIL
jgi:hypothetical protein